MSYINKEDLLEKFKNIINNSNEDKTVLVGRILQATIDFEEEDVIEIKEVKNFLHDLSITMDLKMDEAAEKIISNPYYSQDTMRLDKEYIDGYIDAIIAIKNKKFECPSRLITFPEDRGGYKGNL